ncbi:hypothetical protein NQ318_018373 [Aromia moschata]|uniref:Uncharacterized protein n=1 Tax=Aromia moschata TaxID=1265417 RepID=A0AAV8ZDA1_9CUCU|nr:hypothetical protein NQ318_018373 [Aromia moschata]
MKIPPPTSDVPPFPYQTFTGAPPPVASTYTASFPNSLSAPPTVGAPPHITGPPPGPAATYKCPSSRSFSLREPPTTVYISRASRRPAVLLHKCPTS